MEFIIISFILGGLIILGAYLYNVAYLPYKNQLNLKRLEEQKAEEAYRQAKANHRRAHAEIIAKEKAEYTEIKTKEAIERAEKLKSRKLAEFNEKKVNSKKKENYKRNSL